MISHHHLKGKITSTGVIPAACLSFLTLGTVSVHGGAGDFVLPALATIATLSLSMIIVSLRVGR